MNKKISLLMLFFVPLGTAYADEALTQFRSQTQKIENRVGQLERTSKKTQDGLSDLKRHNADLNSAHKLQQQKLGDLNASLGMLEGQQKTLEGKLNLLEGKQGSLGGLLEQLSRDTDQRTQTIDQTIISRSKWYSGAIALILCLLAGSYWYLRRRSKASEQTLAAQVKTALDTVRSSEERIAKADTALADSLFEILNKLKVQELATYANTQGKSVEPDHNLPLKLADEIQRMRKRLATLPEDTRGLTPLRKSLERLEAELADQGYEIVDHTGMAYSENLSVKARFIPSDEVGLDQKVITKVVTPQVNYKGVLIRMADIEVSIGS